MFSFIHLFFFILIVSFTKYELLILMKSNLFNISTFFMDQVFGVMLKSSPTEAQGKRKRERQEDARIGFEDGVKGLEPRNLLEAEQGMEILSPLELPEGLQPC